MSHNSSPHCSSSHSTSQPAANFIDTWSFGRSGPTFSSSSSSSSSSPSLLSSWTGSIYAVPANMCSIALPRSSASSSSSFSFSFSLTSSTSSPRTAVGSPLPVRPIDNQFPLSALPPSTLSAVLSYLPWRALLTSSAVVCHKWCQLVCGGDSDNGGGVEERTCEGTEIQSDRTTPAADPGSQWRHHIESRRKRVRVTELQNNAATATATNSVDQLVDHLSSVSASHTVTPPPGQPSASSSPSSIPASTLTSICWSGVPLVRVCLVDSLEVDGVISRRVPPWKHNHVHETHNLPATAIDAAAIRATGRALNSLRHVQALSFHYMVTVPMSGEGESIAVSAGASFPCQQPLHAALLSPLRSFTSVRHLTLAIATPREDWPTDRGSFEPLHPDLPVYSLIRSEVTAALLAMTELVSLELIAPTRGGTGVESAEAAACRAAALAWANYGGQRRGGRRGRGGGDGGPAPRGGRGGAAAAAKGIGAVVGNRRDAVAAVLDQQNEARMMVEVSDAVVHPPAPISHAVIVWPGQLLHRLLTKRRLLHVTLPVECLPSLRSASDDSDGSVQRYSHVESLRCSSIHSSQVSPSPSLSSASLLAAFPSLTHLHLDERVDGNVLSGVLKDVSSCLVFLRVEPSCLAAVSSRVMSAMSRLRCLHLKWHIGRDYKDMAAWSALFSPLKLLPSLSQLAITAPGALFKDKRLSTSWIPDLPGLTYLQLDLNRNLMRVDYDFLFSLSQPPSFAGQLTHLDVRGNTIHCPPSAVLVAVERLAGGRLYPSLRRCHFSLGVPLTATALSHEAAGDVIQTTLSSAGLWSTPEDITAEREDVKWQKQRAVQMEREDPTAIFTPAECTFHKMQQLC